MRAVAILALLVALAACSKNDNANLASAGSHLNSAAGQTVDAAKDVAKAAGPEVKKAGQAAGTELEKAGAKVKGSTQNADRNSADGNSAN